MLLAPFRLSHEHAAETNRSPRPMAASVDPQQIVETKFDAMLCRLNHWRLGVMVPIIWNACALVVTCEPSIVLKKRKAISGSLVKEGHG